MPRQRRVEYPGAMYHVMSRGDRREDIFLDDVDRHDFIKTTAEACQKTGWQVHAYCLLRNHYHLVLETPDANRQEFERRTEARRLAETDEEALGALRHGWCLGSGDFKHQMLEQMTGQLGDHHSGQLHLETAEVRAGRIMAEELRRLGWTETELASRRKSDPDKLANAARLRRETTLTLRAITRRVHLGTSKSANARVHQWMRRTIQINPKLP